jgi:hypothetical protein
MASEDLRFLWPFDDDWVSDVEVLDFWVNDVIYGMARTWAAAAAVNADRTGVCQHLLTRPAAAICAADYALQGWVDCHRGRSWYPPQAAAECDLCSYGGGSSWDNIGDLMDFVTAQGAQQYFARRLTPPDRATDELRNIVVESIVTQLRLEAEAETRAPFAPSDPRGGRSDVLARKMHLRLQQHRTHEPLPASWKPAPKDLFRSLWEGRRALVYLEWSSVQAARQLRLSWAQIGSAIGLSRQAAQKRYDPNAPNQGFGGRRNRAALGSAIPAPPAP